VQPLRECQGVREAPGVVLTPPDNTNSAAALSLLAYSGTAPQYPNQVQSTAPAKMGVL